MSDAWRIDFCALGTCVSVAGDDRRLLKPLEALVATYPACRAAESMICYRLGLQPIELWRNEVLIRSVDHELDLLPLFEQDLYTQLTRHAAAGWMLHGAAVARAGRAIVMAGASGAGKSTLALALVARGASYLTDDCALIHPDGKVQGVRRPIGFDPGHQPTTPLPSSFVQSSSEIRVGDGVVRALAVHPPGDCLRDVSQISHVIHIQQGPANRCRFLSCGEAICALWPLSLRRHKEDLEAANGLLPRVCALELTSADVPSAVAAVESLWSGSVPG